LTKGIYAPKALTPSNPPIPIHVFISSDSNEFGPLRKSLCSAIDSECMFNKKRTDEEQELVQQGILMKGILVEAKTDESFDIAMKRGLTNSQIYVGIFGKCYSEPTVKEYHFARKLGLPLMVYCFAQPPHQARSRPGRVLKFLNSEVKPRVTIRANYDRIEVRSEEALVDLILSDLASRAADLVREAVSVRRHFLRAPDTVMAVILRSRDSVFE
jgi:hypothetical protein